MGFTFSLRDSRVVMTFGLSCDDVWVAQSMSWKQALTLLWGVEHLRAAAKFSDRWLYFWIKSAPFCGSIFGSKNGISIGEFRSCPQCFATSMWSCIFSRYFLHGQPHTYGNTAVDSVKVDRLVGDSGPHNIATPLRSGNAASVRDALKLSYASGNRMAEAFETRHQKTSWIDWTSMFDCCIAWESCKKLLLLGLREGCVWKVSSLVAFPGGFKWMRVFCWLSWNLALLKPLKLPKCFSSSLETPLKPLWSFLQALLKPSKPSKPPSPSRPSRLHESLFEASFKPFWSPLSPLSPPPLQDLQDFTKLPYSRPLLPTQCFCVTLMRFYIGTAQLKKVVGWLKTGPLSQQKLPSVG